MEDVAEWHVRVPTDNSDAFARNHRNEHVEHVVASHLGLAIYAEDMCVLIEKRTIAAQKQLRLSRISSDAALNVLLDDFGVIPPAAILRLSSVFAILPTRTICYFAGAVQVCADGLGGVT